MCRIYHISILFFFNDTATTEIYTLSLHDALPIFRSAVRSVARRRRQLDRGGRAHGAHRFRGQRDDRLAVLGAAAGARAPCPGPARTAEIGRASCRERV